MPRFDFMKRGMFCCAERSILWMKTQEILNFFTAESA